MNNQNGHDVENNYKDASEKFLNFMKETREKEKTKEEDDEPIYMDAAVNVSNFVYELTSKCLNAFNKINYWVDIMLASSKRIKILSLFLTVTLCYFVNGGSGITTTKSIDYINEVPVEVRSNDKYHVINYDKTVTLQLIGDFGSIQWAKTMDDYKVILDVENKTEGNYDIQYSVEGLSGNLDVQVLPEKANINISKLDTRSFALDYQFINDDKLDAAYILKEVRLGFSEVDVTSGTATLDRIDRVVANIDVSNVTSSVVDQFATITALDSSGNVLDVKFSNKEVIYDLDVVTHSKVVPIQLFQEGDVNSDYVLTKLKPSNTQVTIYGQEEDLAEINYVVAKVNVDGKAGNATINSIALEKPDKVSKMSIKTISVDIEVEEKISKEISGLTVSFESTPEGLAAKLIGEKVTLKVTGAKSKVEKLSKNNLKIYVDLTNATVGTAKYQLYIANQDTTLQYEFINGQSIDIAVSQIQGTE